MPPTDSANTIKTRAVIKNAVYDTATARKVYAQDPGYAKDDPQSIIETLFQKKTGEFFLYIFGGAETPYATPVDVAKGIYAPGTKFAPLSYEAAKEWGKRRMPAEIYAAVFEQPPDDRDVPLFIKVAPDVAAAIAKAASNQKASKKAIIENLARTHLMGDTSPSEPQK